MSQNFEKATKVFEASVKTICDDLQYLVDHDKVSERFIHKQNKVLLHITNYQNFVEGYIEMFLEDAKARRDRITALEDEVICFKAICKIHGVVNYARFLNWGKYTLLANAKELVEDQKLRLPYMMNKRLAALSIQEREIVEGILFKDVNQKLEELLKRIRETKNPLIYGART